MTFRWREIPGPVWALLAVAVLIRIFNLSGIILYWDEPIHSVRIDAQPLPFVLAHNNASALFAVLVHVLLPLGKLELMARLPSCVFGILLVPLMFFAGRTFFSRREGIVAAALAAFSPFLIRFSQYSRGYSVFVFFTLLALLLLHRARESGRISAWGGYAGAALAAMYTHLMGFMAMTGLSLFAAMEWAVDAMRLKQRATATRRVLLFGLFSFLAAAGAVLLYLPDENVRGFMDSSVDRVSRRLPFAYLASYLTQKILTTQWQSAGWGFALWLAGVGIGLGMTLYRRPRTALLFLFYTLVPFLIFIRINPREVNIQSAERYFIFWLPVLLLLASRGITAAADATARLFESIRGFRMNRKKTSGFLALGITIVVLAGVDLRHYYLNFHRLNTLRIPAEVRSCFQKNAGADARLLFDRFPAPGLHLLLNPLTRDARFRSSEAELRPGLSGAEGFRTMIFRSISDPRVSYSRPFGLWLVTDRTPSKSERAQIFLADRPDVRFFPLEEHLVMHFPPGKDPLGKHVIDASTFLLETDPGWARRREWRLLRARARLIMGRIREGLDDLSEARAHPFPEPAAPDLETPGAFRIPDKLFGLAPEEIFKFYLDYFFHRDTTEVLFAQGEQALENGDREIALALFREAPLWSSHLDRAVSNRIGRIASARMRRGRPREAARLFAEAGRLDPGRAALPGLEAESLRSAGFDEAARQKWRSSLDWKEAPDSALDLLVSDRPLFILKHREDGWLIILRSPRRATFSGRITSDNAILGAAGDLFAAGDRLRRNRRLLEFSVESPAGRLKTMVIRSRARAELTFDLKLDGRRTREAVLIVGESSPPSRLPVRRRGPSGRGRGAGD